MVVRVKCPNPGCSKGYKLDESLVGRSIVCKHCGHEFTVTASSGETMHPDSRTEPPQRAVSGHSAGTDSPRRLGRFEIRGRLGSGAFGTVYRAHDPVLDRDVALKVPRAAALEKPEARARFLREPKAAAQLRHPNIVPVYDAGTAAGRYYIASAFIEGHTLETVIQEKRPHFRQAAAIVRSLAEALDYAHRAGVVHRDVKPANVMIDTRGQPMLMDFGLAHVESSQENLTQDGSLMGTPAYMAPEQANRSMGEVGPASDQYSLGVVLYELLTGQTPFSGPPTVLLFNVVSQEPDRPRKKDATIPRDLETICLKALSKGLQERYADCGAMAEDLRRFLADEPILARPLGPIERAIRWARRNPLLAASMSAAVVLLLAVMLVVAVANVRISHALGTAKTALENETAARRDADLERDKARDAAEAARAARDVAQTVRDQEAAARQEADRQRELADQAAQREAELRRQAEYDLYCTRISLAHQKWLAGDVNGAEDLLDACPPEFRHWEWGYLKRLCHLDLLTIPTDHTARSVAFSPDGTRIATGSWSGKVAVWDAITGEQLLSFSAHARHANAVEFSPDGKRLLTAGDDALAKIWDLSSGDKLGEYPMHIEVDTSLLSGNCTATMSPDGSRIALAARASLVKILDVSTGAEVLTLHADSEYLHAVTFSPDGRRVATVRHCGNRSVKIHDASTGEEIVRLGKHDGWVTCVAFSPDGKRIATGTDTNVLHLWDARSGKRVLDYRGHSAPISSLAWSPDGKRIASAGSDRTIRVWRSDRGKDLCVLRGHSSDVFDVTFSPDGNRIASAGQGATVRVWDSHHAGDVITLAVPADLSASSIATSPNGRSIAVGVWGQVNVFDAASGEQVWSFQGFGDGPVLGVAFSPDGKRLASAHHDHTARLWDVDAGQEIRTLAGHGDVVTDVGFSPDGKWLASASSDATIKIWKLGSAEEPLTLVGHEGGVLRLAFSPDSRQLLSVGRDTSVRVWDVISGKILFGSGSECWHENWVVLRCWVACYA